MDHEIQEALNTEKRELKRRAKEAEDLLYRFYAGSDDGSNIIDFVQKKLIEN